MTGSDPIARAAERLKSEAEQQVQTIKARKDEVAAALLAAQQRLDAPAIALLTAEFEQLSAGLRDARDRLRRLNQIAEEAKEPW